MKSCLSVLCRPGGDLLSQVLRHSTIGAGAFDGRVRDGIGSGRSARATRPAKNGEAKLGFMYLSLGAPLTRGHVWCFPDCLSYVER